MFTQNLVHPVARTRFKNSIQSEKRYKTTWSARTRNISLSWIAFWREKYPFLDTMTASSQVLVLETCQVEWGNILRIVVPKQTHWGHSTNLWYCSQQLPGSESSSEKSAGPKAHPDWHDFAQSDRKAKFPKLNLGLRNFKIYWNTNLESCACLYFESVKQSAIKEMKILMVLASPEKKSFK